MEVKFIKKPLKCLRPFFSQIHTQEQTQEIRLPDAYPDIGKILGCWGQVLMRGKEWRSTSMGANGGVMAWVMYAPEDGTQPRVVDVWIPIQCRWDFPENADDGVMVLRPVLTNLDGRGISARKIMLRACVDTFAQALKKETMEVAEPAEVPEDIQLLTRSYPMELPVEAGEKQVQLEEAFSLPGNLPPIHKIVNYKMSPAVTEQKVLGNRLVFRGEMDVRMMYMTEDGMIHQWETDVPFSQYTELDGDYGPNATAWVMPILTAMEMDLTEDGMLNIRAGIAAQYTIFDRNVLDVVEDAFSPTRDVIPNTEEMLFPILLDSMDMELRAEGTWNEAERILHAWSYGEYPTLYAGNDGMEIHMDGQFQALYQNPEGQMAGDTVRFSSSVPFSSAMENQTHLWMGNPAQPEILPTGDGFSVRSSYPVSMQVYSGQTIPMVTELELGELRQPDPNRPSMILRRAGDEGLWALAKGYGSSVAAIQEANQLTGEPADGQMLLIPIS